MKIKDDEGMIHFTFEANNEFWVESECFQVDMKQRKTVGKTTAKFGPYKTIEDAEDSIKAAVKSYQVIDAPVIADK